jgi:decaprenyl-phosphate phosphoribosyltransferase
MTMPTPHPRPRVMPPHDPPGRGGRPRLVDGGPAQGGPSPDPTGAIGTWVRAVRVRQWTKNLLVFAAPAAGDALGRPRVVLDTLGAFAVFCLLSSGVYLLNDLHDAPEDRRHPLKRHRPIAAGRVSVRAAIGVAIGAFVLAAAVSVAVNVDLLWVACGYVALNVAYTRWLRRVAIADIATISAAFVLRATAGGVAANVPTSRLLIIVVSFAALFVAAGKRHADFVDPAARMSRRVLEDYNVDFLRLVLAAASAVSLGAYCLWALAGGSPDDVVWRQMTIVPFTLAILQYGLLVTRGGGRSPEDVLLADRFTQLVGAAWLVTFGLAI